MTPSTEPGKLRDANRLRMLCIGGKLVRLFEIFSPAFGGAEMQDFFTFAERNRQALGDMHSTDGIAHQFSRHIIVPNFDIGMRTPRPSGHISDNPAEDGKGPGSDQDPE
jgi:hypothetical protein